MKQVKINKVNSGGFYSTKTHKKKEKNLLSKAIAILIKK